MILEAMTDPESPVQPSCMSTTYDSDIHELVGDVPVSAQHLVTTGFELAKKAHAHEEAAQLAALVGDKEQQRQSQLQADSLLEQADIMHHLCQGLFQEYFPHQCANYDYFEIVDGWRLAGVISGQESTDLPPDLLSILSGLGCGRDEAKVHVLRPVSN